jgi:hypothetical protein
MPESNVDLSIHRLFELKQPVKVADIRDKLFHMQIRIWVLPGWLCQITLSCPCLPAVRLMYPLTSNLLRGFFSTPSRTLLRTSMLAHVPKIQDFRGSSKNAN